MSSFEVVTTGLQELIAKLDQPLEPAIDKVTRESAEEARKRISQYPSAPPSSKRTGNLGRSWAVQTASGASFLRSSASYAAFVVGPQQTSGAARVGWKTDAEIAAEVTPLLVNSAEEALTDLLS